MLFDAQAAKVNAHVGALKLETLQSRELGCHSGASSTKSRKIAYPNHSTFHAINGLVDLFIFYTSIVSSSGTPSDS